MMANLSTYLDLLASLCRSAVSTSAPSLLDLLIAASLVGLVLYAILALVRGLRGRDDGESERIKRAILDE
jgi:hypothetical protein